MLDSEIKCNEKTAVDLMTESKNMYVNCLSFRWHYLAHYFSCKGSYQCGTSPAIISLCSCIIRSTQRCTSMHIISNTYHDIMLAYFRIIRCFFLTYLPLGVSTGVWMTHSWCHLFIYVIWILASSWFQGVEQAHVLLMPRKSPTSYAHALHVHANQQSECSIELYVYNLLIVN